MKSDRGQSSDRAANLHDNNTATGWSGGNCLGQGLIHGCQWVVLQFRSALENGFACDFWQHNKNSGLSITKVKLEQSLDQMTWSTPALSDLKSLGKTTVKGAHLVPFSGQYARQMVRTCFIYGMKPVCEHPSLCKADPSAIYLGQDHHLAYRPNRITSSYMPYSAFSNSTTV